MKNFIYYRNRKRLVLIFLSLILIFATISSLVYYIERNNIKEEALITSVGDIDLFNMSFTDKISVINTDVFILKDIVELQNVLELNALNTDFVTEEDRINTENEFLIWLDRKNIYDQARIIDNTGQEILRVNYNQGEPEIVAVESLQNKATRYYFEDSIVLDENEMYISKLDLNVENGAIETIDGVTKPMIRFATPIFDDTGTKLGVIVLNYLASDILNSLYRFESSAYADIEMINEDGYFLFSDYDERLWGFMYDDKADELYSKYHDFDLFENTTETTQQNDYKGYSYTSVEVTAETLSNETSLLLDSDIDVVLGVDDFIIVSSIDIGHIEGIMNLNQLLIYIASIVLILILILSRLLDELFYNKEEKLRIAEYSANHDFLTNIPNRAYIHNLIGYKITRQHGFSLLYIDFDGFKQINDEFGHSIGDEALKAGVKRIKESIRLDDVVARLGGDEFLVVLNNLVNKETVARVCKTLLDNFNETFDLNGNICKMGLSIGVSIHPKDSVNSDDLIDNADTAMYEIKNEGKNNYKFYEDVEDIKE